MNTHTDKRTPEQAGQSGFSIRLRVLESAVSIVMEQNRLRSDRRDIVPEILETANKLYGFVCKKDAGSQ